MVTPVPDPYTGDPNNLRVTYGVGANGEKRYVLRDIVLNVAVFQSDFKSEVIAQAQTLKGFTPVDGSESTYARQLAGQAGEQPLTELMTLRTAMTRAVNTALSEYLLATSTYPDDQTVLGEYEFQVTQSGDTAISVKVQHQADTLWPYTFTINVSGKVTHATEQTV